MAAVKETDTDMILNLNNGTNSAGDVITKARNIDIINPAITNDALYECATALASLQSHDLVSVMKRDTITLAES